MDFAIEGSGFGDVTALPGQTEPHAYFTLIEVGADLSEVGQADTAISASIAEDGTSPMCWTFRLTIWTDEVVRGHLVAVAFVPVR